MVFQDHLALLQTRYSLFQLLELVAVHAEQVFQHAVGYGLLLHNERILRIGVEVEIVALEVGHILGGEYDAQPLITAFGYQATQRCVVEREHVVRLVDDGEMPNLYAFVATRLEDGTSITGGDPPDRRITHCCLEGSTYITRYAEVADEHVPGKHTQPTVWKTVSQ